MVFVECRTVEVQLVQLFHVHESPNVPWSVLSIGPLNIEDISGVLICESPRKMKEDTVLLTVCGSIAVTAIVLACLYNRGCKRIETELTTLIQSVASPLPQ